MPASVTVTVTAFGLIGTIVIPGVSAVWLDALLVLDVRWRDDNDEISTELLDAAVGLLVTVSVLESGEAVLVDEADIGVLYDVAPREVEVVDVG